jgi:hypothetical protein
LGDGRPGADRAHDAGTDGMKGNVALRLDDGEPVALHCPDVARRSTTSLVSFSWVIHTVPRSTRSVAPRMSLIASVSRLRRSIVVEVMVHLL